MTTALTRERVLEEIAELDGEIGDLIERVAPGREKLSSELQHALDELQESIVLARQFTTSNTMDFRQAEVGLMQLRPLRAEILISFEGSNS